MKNKNYFKLNLIYFTALICIAVLFTLSAFGILINEWLSSFLIQIVVMAAIPILMYKLLFKKSFKDTAKDIGLKKISSKSVLIIVILGFALYFLNSYVSTFFNTLISLFGYEKLTQAQGSFKASYPMFLQDFLLTAILPAICEEILHRGIMLNCTKKYNNTKTCLLISSIIFGLTHLNITQFFYAAILGYLMGYLNLACDSLYPSIIVHFMNNFLSVYFSYGKAFNWPFATFVFELEALIASNIILFIIITSISVLAILALFSYLSKVLMKEKAKQDIRNIVNCLKLNQLEITEAQSRINEANKILTAKSYILKTERKQKTSFTDNIFLISAIVLGLSVTIFSFVWGII